MPRADLLPALRRADVHTLVLVHDVMPLLFPQWFTAQHAQVFRDWLTAQLHHAELFLANSHCTAADLRRRRRRAGSGSAARRARRAPRRRLPGAGAP